MSRVRSLKIAFFIFLFACVGLFFSNSFLLDRINSRASNFALQSEENTVLLTNGGEGTVRLDALPKTLPPQYMPENYVRLGETGGEFGTDS